MKIYDIKKTDKGLENIVSKQRFFIVRNVNECPGISNWVEYHMCVESDFNYPYKGNVFSASISLDRKYKVVQCTSNARDIAEKSGFKSVQEFADHFNRDFNGFIFHYTDFRY